MEATLEFDPKVTQFIYDNPQGVLTTYRRSGRAQMSIVTVRPHSEGVAVSITENRIKFKNLRKDAACSILISATDWWSGFIVIDGTADMTWSGNSDSESLRLARQEIYSVTTHRRATDWDEYDRLVDEDKRVAPIIRPDHMYGTFFDSGWKNRQARTR